jgi:hypothetical protein
MAILNGYATLPEFLSRYVPAAPTDAARDTTIEGTIQAVSRSIDLLGPRRFWVNAADALETRYCTVKKLIGGLFWLPDDVVSITTLASDNDGDGTYEVTWAATDYKLGPPNAALDGWPYNYIRRLPLGLCWLPEGIEDGIKIIGRFGFPAVPAQITEACYLQSYRLYLRKTSPFGVAGSADMGQVMVIPKLDPDIELQIQPFLRHT